MKLMLLGASDHTKLRTMARYFLHAGWQVSVVSFVNEPISEVNFYHLDVGNIKSAGKNYRYLLKLPAIKKIIKLEKPDIIDCHFLTSYGLLGYLASGETNFVVNIYGTDIYKNAISSFAYNFITGKIFSKSSQIFSLSDTMTNFVDKNFPGNQSKITNLQYGTDSNSFQISKDFSNREYDFIANRLFVENSNYRIILEAFWGASEQNPDLKMLIFGKGPLKEFIVSFIEKNNLKNRITLLDFVEHDKLPIILNSGKYYLSITDSDGTPNSLFEAIFCGMYPILSDIEQNREWGIKGIDTEYIKNDRNVVHALKEKMLHLAKNFPTQNTINNNRIISVSFMDYNKNISLLEEKMRSIASM